MGHDSAAVGVSEVPDTDEGDGRIAEAEKLNIEGPLGTGLKLALSTAESCSGLRGVVCALSGTKLAAAIKLRAGGGDELNDKSSGRLAAPWTCASSGTKLAAAIKLGAGGGEATNDKLDDRLATPAACALGETKLVAAIKLGAGGGDMSSIKLAEGGDQSSGCLPCATALCDIPIDTGGNVALEFSNIQTGM